MKDIHKTLKSLQRHGFRVEQGKSSLIKVFPPNPALPMYSLHIADRAFFPLSRFAKKNWALDLERI